MGIFEQDTSEPMWESFAGGCCGHAGEVQHEEHRGVSRRGMLLTAGVGALTVGMARPGHAAASDIGSASKALEKVYPRSLSGVQRSALHIHSSFSEGSGGLAKYGDPNKTQASMESHADSLDTLGYDLVMYTDHDHRMAAEEPGIARKPFPSVENFSRPQWQYSKDPQGGATGSFDLGANGLRVNCTTGSTPGAMLVFADCFEENWNYRSTLAGTMMKVTLVPPTSGYAEFRIVTSHRPATGARDEGAYELRYRFDPRALAESVVGGRNRVVTVTIPARGTQEKSFWVNPTGDLANAYDDLQGLEQDFGCYGLWFGVGGGARVSNSATFVRLDIDRGADMDNAIAIQQSIMEELARRYPRLTLAQGIEMSYAAHLNWLATSPVSPFPPQDGQGVAAYLRASVDMIRRNNGASSYNHMFGALRGPLLTGTQRRAKIDQIAKQMMGHGAYGSDLLEVGYNMRGFVDLAAHLEVWDIMLAGGYRIFANGVSDNHNGPLRSYEVDPNCFSTDILSATPNPFTSIPALRSGRAFVSAVGAFNGRLDLETSSAVMGQTHRGSENTVEVNLTARGAAGMTMKVYQYAIHGNKGNLRRQAPLKSTSKVVDSAESLSVSVENRPSYVRGEIFRDGQCVAFTNPLFLSGS